MDCKKAVSIVLGTYNRLSFLQLTIASVRAEIAQLAKPCEIIVIDGGSSDGTIEWLCLQKDIITIVQHNRGEWQGVPISRRSWGYFMNLGFKCAQGKYVCMISDDSIFIGGALKNGYEDFEQFLVAGCKVGALAFYWRDVPQDEDYHVGNPMHSIAYVNHGMYLRSALHEINFIEENKLQFYFADIDLCFRLHDAGYFCLEASNSYIEHYQYANMVIRKGNEVIGKQDFKKFLELWGSKYPTLTNHSVGWIKKKKFYDAATTVSFFDVLHKQVQEENPKLFAKPSYSVQFWQTVKWKVKMYVRKIGLFN